MRITEDIINKTINALNSLGDNEFYIMGEDLPFIDKSKDRPRLVIGLLTKLEIFDKHSENAIKFSGKGHKMIINGITDWKSYQKSKNSNKGNGWKIATIIIAVLGLIPSYYAIYNDKKADTYKKELDQLQELHKSFVDSIRSIENEKKIDTLIEDTSLAK